MCKQGKNTQLSKNKTSGSRTPWLTRAVHGCSLEGRREGLSWSGVDPVAECKCRSMMTTLQKEGDGGEGEERGGAYRRRIRALDDVRPPPDLSRREEWVTREKARTTHAQAPLWGQRGGRCAGKERLPDMEVYLGRRSPDLCWKGASPGRRSPDRSMYTSPRAAQREEGRLNRMSWGWPGPVLRLDGRTMADQMPTRWN